MDSRLRLPVVLVKTWVSLINSSESSEVQDRAYQMLMSAFSQDMQRIVAYCQEHRIKIK